MSHSQLYEMADMDYSNEGFSRRSAKKESKSRAPSHSRRRGKTPQSVNGIHRRRNRKLSW